MKKLITLCLFLGACSQEGATLYTPCEPTKDKAYATASKMAGLFCATGDKTNRYVTEFGGLDRCVKPDASIGWYVKFEVTCRGELP